MGTQIWRLSPILEVQFQLYNFKFKVKKGYHFFTMPYWMDQEGIVQWTTGHSPVAGYTPLYIHALWAGQPQGNTTPTMIVEDSHGWGNPEPTGVNLIEQFEEAANNVIDLTGDEGTSNDNPIDLTAEAAEDKEEDMDFHPDDIWDETTQEYSPEDEEYLEGDEAEI